ncbi:hypothetical protein FB45DRAFT_907923, partial [Roridomyces roridus]
MARTRRVIQLSVALSYVTLLATTNRPHNFRRIPIETPTGRTRAIDCLQLPQTHGFSKFQGDSGPAMLPQNCVRPESASGAPSGSHNVHSFVSGQRRSKIDDYFL